MLRRYEKLSPCTTACLHGTTLSTLSFLIIYYWIQPTVLEITVYLIKTLREQTLTHFIHRQKTHQWLGGFSCLAGTDTIVDIQFFSNPPVTFWNLAPLSHTDSHSPFSHTHLTQHPTLCHENTCRRITSVSHSLFRGRLPLLQHAQFGNCHFTSGKQLWHSCTILKAYLCSHTG